MWWSSSTYDERLTNWFDLRNDISNLDLETALNKVNSWWFDVPFVNKHLHPQDVQNWPSPWEMLADNLYCDLARGLGMMYTLMATNIAEVEEMAIIYADNEYFLAINNMTYILNYSVSSITPKNLTGLESSYVIVTSKDDAIKKKIGK